MKKALIVGAAGFVGPYLAAQLSAENKMKVYATKLPNEKFCAINVETYDLNVLNYEKICELLNMIRPDYIFHLAAQSSVAAAWKNPGLTIDINIKGSVNVLDAVRELDYKPRILLIGSGEEYGHVCLEEIPINENNFLRPGNIYAVTKVCQNMIAQIYVEAYKMELVMVRAFNHIGPGQAPVFVISDFCKQVAEIEKGNKKPVIAVGNLSARRDFTDVRDVVCAYELLAEKGQAGETYNVGSGHAVEIRKVLDIIISQSNMNIDVVVDPDKMRPVDVPIIEADTRKIYKATGWKQKISLEQTIQETLNYWRKRIG